MDFTEEVDWLASDVQLRLRGLGSRIRKSDHEISYESLRYVLVLSGHCFDNQVTSITIIPEVL
jgi:hypothetical protein